jgi:nicotinamidase-related amidase
MNDARREDLLEQLLARRPVRLANAELDRLPPEEQAIVADLQETLARMTAALPADAPSPTLRARLMATLAHRAPRRALVVVDMINDHLRPGTILEVPRARAIVPALRARLDAARAAKVPVVYVLDRHEASDSDLDDWGNHALDGTDGAEVWSELAPQPGDHLVTKPSYSGFYRSTLQAKLEELAVDTLVLTGCATELQLMTTAADALQLGYAVEVPADSHAGTNELLEMAAFQVMAVMPPYGPSRQALLARLAPP